MKIFPVYYFPPISWFAAAVHEGEFVLEIWEHFRKQQLYNRTRIMTANKVLNISIPIQKAKEHTPVCKRMLSYDWNWQREHWVSLTSAYRSSPYFEFYEDQLEALFSEKRESLLALNIAAIEMVREALDLDFDFTLSDQYKPSEAYEKDYRKAFDPKGVHLPAEFEAMPYQQVFGEEFAQDLSIIDLMCCMGPRAGALLRESWKTESKGRVGG